MKRIITIPLCMLWFALFGQTPQFAVVRPDGTSYMCPSFDSAYNKSQNGDYIYLPGGVHTVTNIMNKSLRIIGAGGDEDSTMATAPTVLENLRIGVNASNGYLEGVKTVSSLIFESGGNLSNYTIKRVVLPGGIYLMANVTIEQLNVSNSYIGSSVLGTGTRSYSILGNGIINNSQFSNNRIMADFNVTGTSNLFINNLFFYAQSFSSINLFPSSTYSNNFFQNFMGVATNYSIFYNNINGADPGPTNIVYNRITESPDLTFINPGSVSSNGWIGYDKHNNYHLKSTSLGKNSGTDGTDRGDYGGATPWVEGIVPSNPHIYYKQIAPQTNSNGQLQIEIRVRTNN